MPNCFVTTAFSRRLILQPNFASSSADPALMRRQPLLLIKRNPNCHNSRLRLS
jgi:hypothetical protein